MWWDLFGFSNLKNEIEVAALWADVDVQLVADREEIESIFAPTFNTPSDDKELKVQPEISIKTDPEDSNKRGGTMNTTSSNEIEDMVHEIFDAPQAQLSEIEAKKNPEDFNIRRESINKLSDIKELEVQSGIEAIADRSRATEAKSMVVQSREIDTTTPPEDSNTGGETNKPSIDEGGVFCISTAPRNPAGTVAAALT